MYTNKHYKELSIEPIENINAREKCEIANKAAILLLDSFPEFNLDYLNIVDLLQHTDMYISKVPENLSPVNYSYTDETFYISDEIELNIENEFFLHEIIHRIQEYRTKKNKLLSLGICNVLETKIEGLAINEAAIQYLVCKILKKEQKIVRIYNMNIQTISNSYYPIITNLIEQIAFLLGDKFLIDSALNSKEDFKYNTIDYLGETNYFTIQKNFDKILEAKDNILKNKDYIENVSTIQNVYVETQKIIFTSYFERIFKRIETIDELKKYSKKLFHYRHLIGANNAEYYYVEYYRNKKEEIKQKEYELEHMSLMVVKDSAVLKAFRKIKDYISRFIFQN